MYTANADNYCCTNNICFMGSIIMHIHSRKAEKGETLALVILIIAKFAQQYCLIMLLNGDLTCFVNYVFFLFA